MSVMRDYYIWLKDNGRTDSPESQQAYMAIQNSAPSSPWHLDGKGIIDGGDVGGDIQVGTAWSVRYIRDDMPGSLITVNVYAVDHDNDNPDRRGEEFAIQTQTEFMVCADPSDPGGTEIWSDLDYEDGVFAYETLAEAETAAREAAENDNTEAAASAQGWDGKPHYGKDA